MLQSPAVKLVPLTVILLAALCLRSLYLTTPLADAHRWRQTDNATVAYNFAFDRFDIFSPQVNWGGPGDAAVEMEFPLLPAIVAVFYRVFGDSHVFGRAVVIVSSLGLIAVTYCIGRRLLGEAEARGAAFLLAVSPTAVYFGRAFIVDTPTVFLSASAVLGFLVYAQEGRRPAAVLGGICLALAWLVKLPALLVLGPVAYIAWRARGWSAIQDPWFAGPIVVALLLTVAWYWHANNIYLRTGLTVGIWRGAGTYPGVLGQLAGETSTFTGWSTREMLTDPAFYRRLFERFWTLHLTPLGAVLTVAGIVLAAGRRGSDLVYVWLAAALAFIIFVGQGNLNHEYYQLPAFPPLALMFGVAAAPLFSDQPYSGWVRSLWLRRTIQVVLLGAAVALFAVGFSRSQVIPNYFRPDSLDMGPVRTGEAIARVTAPDATFIVVEHTRIVNAANSPMLLYHARRRGWSFDLVSLTPAAMEELIHRGVHYFVTTVWNQLAVTRPEVAQMLKEYEEIPLEDAPEGSRLFRLQPASGKPAR
jgi:4-amino-4-deoxy-L-arabinose transferase-like glycosyltransferase